MVTRPLAPMTGDDSFESSRSKPHPQHLSISWQRGANTGKSDL